MIKAYITRTLNNVTHYNTTPIFSSSIHEQFIKKNSDDFKEICITDGYCRVVPTKETNIYLYSPSLYWRDKVDDLNILSEEEKVFELLFSGKDINLFGSNNFINSLSRYIDSYYLQTLDVYCYGKNLSICNDIPIWFNMVKRDTEAISLTNKVSFTIEHKLEIENCNRTEEVWRNLYAN